MSAFLRKYGTGTGADVYIPLVTAGATDTNPTWTPAAGDVKISKDGGAAANIGTLPTSVTMGNSKTWKFVFTDAELQAKVIAVTVSDSATKAVEDTQFNIETYGNASALHPFDLATATQSVNVTQFGGSAGTFASGRPEVNTTHWGGTAVASAVVGADIQTIKTQTVTCAAGVTVGAYVGGTGAAALETTAQSILTDTAEIGTAGAGLTAIPNMATATNQLTIAGYIDTEIGIIISHLTDIKGTGFVKDTHSLPQCLTATGFSTHSAADVRTEMDANSTQLAAIVADTNELQTDWANGGRLDLIVDATLADTNELQGDWANGGRLDLILDARASQTTADAIEADTQDIQSRIPAALVSGKMDADARAVNSSTAAAVRLALSAAQIIPGTVDTVTNSHTPTTTEFQADDITEATDDHYNGRVIIFTSGALLGQATSISDYTTAGGIGQFTVVALTEAPANDDTFIII